MNQDTQETIDKKAQEFAERKTEKTDNQKIEKISEQLVRIVREIQTIKSDNLLISQHLKAYSDKYKELILSMQTDQANFQSVSDEVVRAIAKQIDTQSDVGYKALIKQLLISDNEAKENAIKPQSKKEKNQSKEKKSSPMQMIFNIFISLLCIINLILIFMKG